MGVGHWHVHAQHAEAGAVVEDRSLFTKTVVQSVENAATPCIDLTCGDSGVAYFHYAETKSADPRNPRHLNSIASWLAFSISAVAGFSVVLCLGHIDCGQWKLESELWSRRDFRALNSVSVT